MARQSAIAACVVMLCLALHGSAREAAAQPLPAPGFPPERQNVFYGAVPDGGANAPVIVFVHGVNGVAADWWQPPNDMYSLAFGAGYRTAFISLSVNNSRNNEAIVPNALVIRQALPAIVLRYKVPRVYVVAHSKGGVDVQSAMLDPSTSLLIRAVFTLGTPHYGTEIADWAFGVGRPIAQPLGLVTPAIGALTLARMAAFRQAADPVAFLQGVPFYTIAGDGGAYPSNPITDVTAPVLTSLTSAEPSDGLVPVARTRLPSNYATDLGTVPVGHFALSMGSSVFPRVNAQIRTLEGGEFELIATRGFSLDGVGNPLPGSHQNSYPWSMEWFKGKLYVGTGRAFLCATAATSEAATGGNAYPPPSTPAVDCTADPKDLPLAAEIWRFTPETSVWERVYQSPMDVGIEFDGDGNPTKFTARDMAFRGMAVFKENDAAGTERLYVGGVSASSLFDTLPAFSDPMVRKYPPPRLLWSDDGTTWNEVPQTAGTFFGDIGNQTAELVKKRGFRSFASLRDASGVNRLFVTLSDLRGVGRVIASSDPSAGDDAWRQVSPSADVLPIFTIYTHRNALWATVGEDWYPNGYAIFRTDASTPDPLDPTRYEFEPVVQGDGLQSFRARGAISMQEFKGRLYVGTDRPTELIRINPDDSWDLIVGPPRQTASGFKVPLSRITGRGFNNGFNGHFYSMTVHDDTLYLGTWDWSQLLQGTLLSGAFTSSYGFDFFKSRDGVHWTAIDRNGFGDPLNSSIRNLVSTPFGLFVGVTNHHTGLQIFRSKAVLDLTRDGPIDMRDVLVILSALNKRAKGGTDPRDLDRDGRITTKDAVKLATQCTKRTCLPAQPTLVAAPRNVKALVEGPRGNRKVVMWTAAHDAVRYHVFRSEQRGLFDMLPTTPVTLPDGRVIRMEDVNNGDFDSVCDSDPGESLLCSFVDAVRANTAVSRPFRWIGSTRGRTFTDAAAPRSGDIFYYVVAENAWGRVSEPSAFVVAPATE